MDLFALIAAFGGGVFGGVVGALPAFIFTGFVVIAGSAVALSGAGADLVVGNIGFGSLFGPHIGFASGVAAAAYAANKKKLMANGADILTAPFGLNDASPLLVAGVFGVAGYLINYIFASVLRIPTDTIALTVATSGIISRFAFGSTGLTGKYEGSGAREWTPAGTNLVKSIVLGVGMGCIVGGIAASIYVAGGSNVIGAFPGLIFGISAATLIFAQTGFAVPATHQITLPAANAAVGALLATGNPAFAVAMAILFAVLGSFIGDTVGRTFNSHCDTHIDPPAITIFLLTFVTMIIW